VKWSYSHLHGRIGVCSQEDIVLGDSALLDESGFTCTRLEFVQNLLVPGVDLSFEFDQPV